ncbi:MAG: TrbI/VirB10 family protein [Bryobacterales bacterium]|nr:TrbI/VirB10 family protein [Bryobacterales bacterium]
MRGLSPRSVTVMALALALSASAPTQESPGSATSGNTSSGSTAPARDETLPQLKTSRPAGQGGWKSVDASESSPDGQSAASGGSFEVPPGTRIPLSLINSVSTRSAAPGDRVYLETTFPIFVNGKIVIPPGSYVLGTITTTKRPGRVKGKGQMHLRFDSITLPNGVTRDFRARVGGLDGGLREGLDREEGTVKGDSSKGSDTMTAVGTTVTGAQVGALGGLAAGSAGRGAGIGLAAGAAAGLATVLLTRGPDIVLPSGTNLELVTDRPLTFTPDDIKFEGTMQRSVIRPAPTPQVNQQSTGRGGIGGIGGIGGPF